MPTHGRRRTAPDAANAFGSDPIVVAYGAGVESTVMLIGLRHRRIKPKLILFADTGSEKRESVAYLPIIDAWLEANGLPPVTIVNAAVRGRSTLRCMANACAKARCRHSPMADTRVA